MVHPLVIYEDDDLIAVDKPAGWLTVPGRTAEKQDCLYHRLRETFRELLVVHRLDRDTSGLILFARNRHTQSELGRHFAAGQIRKSYLAWVSGRVGHDSGQIDQPIGRAHCGGLPPRYRIDHAAGRPAQTRWRTLHRKTDRSRLWLRPLTGRSHQLRVHCLSLGHPVLGDPIYGFDAADRMYLHAFRLRFPHPTRAGILTLEAAAPF